MNRLVRWWEDERTKESEWINSVEIGTYRATCYYASTYQQNKAWYIKDIQSIDETTKICNSKCDYLRLLQQYDEFVYVLRTWTV